MKKCWNIRSLLIRVKYWCFKFIELVAVITVQKHNTCMFWKCNLSLELIMFHQCWAVSHIMLMYYKIQATLCLLCILLSGTSCGQRLSFTFNFYSINSSVVWCDICAANFLFLTVLVIYSPVPVAFHVVYKDKNVTAVGTTRYCFKQRGDRLWSTWGRVSASHPATENVTLV